MPPTRYSLPERINRLTPQHDGLFDNAELIDVTNGDLIDATNIQQYPSTTTSATLKATASPLPLSPFTQSSLSHIPPPIRSAVTPTALDAATTTAVATTTTTATATDDTPSPPPSQGPPPGIIALIVLLLLTLLAFATYKLTLHIVRRLNLSAMGLSNQDYVALIYEPYILLPRRQRARSSLELPYHHDNFEFQTPDYQPPPQRQSHYQYLTAQQQQRQSQEQLQRKQRHYQLQQQAQREMHGNKWQAQLQDNFAGFGDTFKGLEKAFQNQKTRVTCQIEAHRTERHIKRQTKLLLPKESWKTRAFKKVTLRAMGGLTETEFREALKRGKEVVGMGGLKYSAPEGEIVEMEGDEEIVGDSSPASGSYGSIGGIDIGERDGEEGYLKDRGLCPTLDGEVGRTGHNRLSTSAVGGLERDTRASMVERASGFYQGRREEVDWPFVNNGLSYTVDTDANREDDAGGDMGVVSSAGEVEDCCDGGEGLWLDEGDREGEEDE